MKMYKGFDPNLRCSGFQYEIGKTYEITDKPVLCSHGFHACRTLDQVFIYYPPVNHTLEKNRFCEVEGDGEYEKGDDKYVFQRITIVRELDFSEIANICKAYVYEIAANTRPNHMVMTPNTICCIGANNGYWAYVSTEGANSIASTTGSNSISEAFGMDSIACGNCSHSKSVVNGRNSVALALSGYAVANHRDSIAVVAKRGCAKGVLGSTLVFIKDGIAQSVKVGGNILPNTWYTISEDGRIVLVKDKYVIG